MNIASLVITQTAAKSTTDQRWGACAAIAQDFPALGYLHSHQTKDRGAKAAAHVHLVVAIPGTTVNAWAANAVAALAGQFPASLFTVSSPDTWIWNPDSLPGLLRYIIGNERHQTPEPCYWTQSPYRAEQRALDAALAHSFKRRAA